MATDDINLSTEKIYETLSIGLHSVKTKNTALFNLNLVDRYSDGKCNDELIFLLDYPLYEDEDIFNKLLSCSDTKVLYSALSDEQKNNKEIILKLIVKDPSLMANIIINNKDLLKDDYFLTKATQQNKKIARFFVNSVVTNMILRNVKRLKEKNINLSKMCDSKKECSDVSYFYRRFKDTEYKRKDENTQLKHACNVVNVDEICVDLYAHYLQKGETVEALQYLKKAYELKNPLAMKFVSEHSEIKKYW